MAIRVPKPLSGDIQIRLAESGREIEAANWLVFRNYVEDGFWEEDETQVRNNKFLNSPSRRIFVALREGELIGTLSIVTDSLLGLPSDETQIEPMRALRSMDQSIAEISAFAMDRAASSSKTVFLYLIGYMFQYSLYYAGVDRLIASCKPSHADFYVSNLCFSRLSNLTYYDYSRASGYLIGLNLMDAHRLFSKRYPPDRRSGGGVYRFLFCDAQPCHQYPVRTSQKRTRKMTWPQGARKVA